MDTSSARPASRRDEKVVEPKPTKRSPGLRVERHRLSPTVRVSSFRSVAGAEEVHLFVEPPEDGSFEEQLAQVVGLYHHALDQLALPRHTAVFRRCFLSDAANQLDAVMASSLGPREASGSSAAVSGIEQPPLCYRKLALMAYHVADVVPEHKELIRLPQAGRHAHALSVQRSGRTLLYAAQLTGTAYLSGAGGQTREIFDHYCELLRSQGATLADDCLRTWLFVHDVDRHYQQMVEARRELFLEQGLTPQSHYIVSTGIEGRTGDARSLVCFDALAMPGQRPGQLRFIDRLDHLNRTDDYGVTFERAGRLDHADRSHVFLSGTASIDPKGDVVHVGRVIGQVERTLENVDALLESAGSSLDDLAAMIVYLRDGADAERVTSLLERLVPDLPFTTVRAPVCRPTWLVEIEGLAIVENDDPRWPIF